MAEKIGQILIRKGKITPARLRDALRTQQFFGGYLGSHLINLGFIDEATLGETLSEIYRVPFASYESIRLASPEAIAAVSSALARKFRVIPIQVEGSRLHLAMLNPRDSAALKEIAAATKLTITPWVAPEFRIAHALDKHYRIRRERTIPLRRASQGEGGPAAPADGGVYGSLPWDGTERRTSPRPPPALPSGAAGPELGLDGHPLDAPVPPDFGGTVHRTDADSVEWVPRSLQEWRDADPDGAAARPARGASPAPATPSARPASPAPSTSSAASASSRSRTASAPSPSASHPAPATGSPSGPPPGPGSHRESQNGAAATAALREEAREVVREHTRHVPARMSARPDPGRSDAGAGTVGRQADHPRSPEAPGPRVEPPLSPGRVARGPGLPPAVTPATAAGPKSSDRPSHPPAASGPSAASSSPAKRQAPIPPLARTGSPSAPAVKMDRRHFATETEVEEAPLAAPPTPLAAAERAHEVDPAHEALLADVSSAADRDVLMARAVEVLDKSFRRVVAFAVKGAEARAILTGPGLDAAALARHVVPLDRPSLLSSARTQIQVHVAPPPTSDATRELHAAMGGGTASALVIPVALRERLVLIFYADNGEAPIGAVDLSLWKRLARICTISLEIFILKNRMRQL